MFRSMTVALGLSGLLVATSQATILTFDSGGGVPITTGDPFMDLTHRDYGAAVTSTAMDLGDRIHNYGVDSEGFTPDLVVDWSGIDQGTPRPWLPNTADRALFYDNGYGVLTNIIYLQQNVGSTSTTAGTGPLLGLRSTDPSIKVQFYGLQVDAFGSDLDFSIEIYDGSLDPGDLVYDSGVLSTSGDPANIGTQVGGSPLVEGQELIIVITRESPGNPNLLGVDNIRFGQAVVPEPGSMGLLVIGGLLIFRRLKA